MTTERSPSTKRTRLSASCLVGVVRLPAEAVRRMTYVLPPFSEIIVACSTNFVNFKN